MGYYSNLKVTLEKQDYLEMLEKSKLNSNELNLFDGDKLANIKDYEVNGIECVVIDHYSVKYYEEFEEIQEFEKLLDTAKQGYVFLRTGNSWDDLEYRNTAKIKELEHPFKFIQATRETVEKEFEEKKYIWYWENVEANSMTDTLMGFHMYNDTNETRYDALMSWILTDDKDYKQKMISYYYSFDKDFYEYSMERLEKEYEKVLEHEDIVQENEEDFEFEGDE